MGKPVIIFGAKGLGKASLEILKSGGFDVLGFLDDDESLAGTEIDNVPVLGTTSDEKYLKMLGEKSDSFVAFDDKAERKKQVEILIKEYKSMPINALHKEANIPESVFLGHGNFINAAAVLGSYAKVSSHCIINSGAILEHDVVIKDFVQVGAGSIINAGVVIEEGAFIGSGVTIVAGVTIGKNANVGAGSVVVNNVGKGKAVFGNPAKEVSI